MTQAIFLNGLGNQRPGVTDQFRKELDEALASYEQALERFNAIGDRLKQANVRQSLGELYLGINELDSVKEGIEMLDQALALYQQIGDRVGHCCEKYEAVLAKVPDVEADEFDRLDMGLQL